MATHISVRMTGDGSAVMHVIDAGTPHEMVTMFYMDKETLMATHYCSAHNQPRFEAAASPNPGDHLHVQGQHEHPTRRRAHVSPGDHAGNADHHNEDWGYDLGGKVSTGTFT